MSENHNLVDFVKHAWSLRYVDSRKMGVLGAELLASGIAANTSAEIAYGKLLIAVSNFLNSKDEHVLDYLLDAFGQF